MFEQCLYFNTTSLARQLEREWSGAFKPFGLTPSQAFMLRVILENEAITGTDLAATLNISKATCSRTADGLVALGFVTKIQANNDGRSYELHPSLEAKSIKDALSKSSAEVGKKIKRAAGVEAFEKTVKHLRNISTNLK
jgi:DNA-binding MarR family transcriptional regulator